VITVTLPATPTARRARIESILRRRRITSQEQLREVLAADGIRVTQATLSRDLVEIQAVKVNDDTGTRYVVPDRAGGGESSDSRLTRTLGEVLTSADHSGNIVVLRTTPGAAQFLASAVDLSGWTEIIGTVAGDDTVLVVTKHPHGGRELADRIVNLAQKG
jgi:transcriptional regulator of arginine metabolism